MHPVTRVLAPLGFLLALLVPAGAATAAPVTSERSETFALDTSTCNGAFVVGEGTLHIVSKVQSNGTVSARINLHAAGVGTDGNQYVMNWTQTRLTSETDVSGESHVRLISKGSAPNQLLLASFDTATGELSFEPACRG